MSKKKARRAAIQAENAGSFESKPDTSVYVYQDAVLKTPLEVNCRYKLTERQSVIVETAMDKMSKVIMIDGYWGTGKAQPLTSKILTPKGWVKMGDIKVGDEVISSDGLPTKVTGVFPQGEKDIYRVVFSDGSMTECCLDHLWLTQTEAERNKILRKRNGGNPIYNKTPIPPKVRSLSEIKNSLLVSGDHLNHSIPIVSPVKFEPQKHYIHPYILGVLLGDGSFRETVSFTSADEDIPLKLESFLPCDLILSRTADPMEFSIIRSDRQRGMYRPNPMKVELQRLGLWGHESCDKFIPQEYLLDSVENRIELLRGLMDTDGTVSKHHVVFCTSSSQLAEGVRFIVRSLGGTAVTTQSIPTYTHNGEKKHGRLAYRISVKLPNSINPFHLPRKRDKIIERKKYFPMRYFKSIELVGKQPAQCISVENPSHLYVTDDFIVTHNTALATLASLKLMNEKKVSGIVYLRNPLEATNTAKVGTLPGDLNVRMEAYNVILFDKLKEFLPKSDIDRLKKEERIECLPVGLIQGKTFARKAVIVDEAASLSYDDLMLVVSRLGEHGKLFIVGDSTFQLSIGSKSGFKRFYDIFDDQESMENGIFTFELKRKEDILRSGLLRFVMEKTGVITRV